MAEYVVLVDISGSMRCKLKILKDFLKTYWLPWLMETPPVNDVALIAFSNDVCVLSRYTKDLSCLQTLIDGLVTSGCGGAMTSLYDAIIVGLVFEDPKPDALYVWSDLADTRSDSSNSDWTNLANSIGLGVGSVHLCPPYPWMEDPNCPRMAVLVKPPIKAIPFKRSLALAKEITKISKVARAIEAPEQFLKAKVAQKKK
jgi:hypothetical protein